MIISIPKNCGRHELMKSILEVLRKTDASSEENIFADFIEMLPIIEVRSGHKYEIIYDHDYPDLAVLIRRGDIE